MTTATVRDITVPRLGGRRHFVLRRLHSLTGIVFGGYVALHLFINATIVQGGNIYQAQVDKIRLLPFLTGIEWAFIYLPIIYHTLYGAWIILSGQPNNASYPFFKNQLYLMQRVSAIILAAFILYHVLAMKGLFGPAFEPTRATWSTVNSIAPHWAVAYLVYPIGILAACFHTANGFWTAGVSWGLTISSMGQRRWGWVCFVSFCGMTATGFVALAATLVASHAK